MVGKIDLESKINIILIQETERYKGVQRDAKEENKEGGYFQYFGWYFPNMSYIFYQERKKNNGTKTVRM